MVALNQKVDLPILKQKDITLYIKREDKIHPFISGNKYRKLKYNIIAAQEQGFSRLLTFGGAFSNHIAATAYAGKKCGFETIGVIRGEEIKSKWQNNPTLQFAFENGMKFEFVSRAIYQNKDDVDFQNHLKTKYGTCYILPEGGTNTFAVKGCGEILNNGDAVFDVITCCVGTGGTLAGIINASWPYQKVLGFPALKGDFLKEDIRKFVSKENWELRTDYHFGGYAKINETLIDFINAFKEQTGVPLDPVYTGKMMFGLLDLIKKNQIKKGTKVLAVHSGGLQGIAGMNQRLKNKNLPLLHT
ncbi:1-aminocyclopropane-1-carboxylate deaminase/D-cysteine desulfhydrase [Costertonia aggregata]|uniref:1-aminocyclopropane-1-carboxylate deaminase/D-cysteine desulfhydrase n=1 Tax=Costertonia aggregata TaxID=343403 RepID=A0A7H9AR49_9FLAO|nr:1-aminocyclopropane-1-carboxylate deaminase/D-cysteine desulfhydrase [Costertonia aggregata]